jgi:uncharacterized protein (TIGR02996 family)
MTDQDAFLRTIIENPDDDTPRLVFADWLEENGDPERAEFIRLQIQSDPILVWDARMFSMMDRIGDLQRRHESRWRPKLPVEWPVIFRRGFAEGLTMTANEFHANTEMLFRIMPFLRVRFSDFDIDEFEHILPYLARLRTIGLSHSPWFARRIESAPAIALPNLKELYLEGLGLTMPPFEHILQRLPAPNLKDLRIYDVPLRIETMALIARSFGELSALFLTASDEQLTYQDRLRAVGAHAIAGTASLHNLRSLDLSGQLIGDAGLIHLARSPYLAKLEALYLDRNEIGAIGTSAIEEFASSRFLKQVRSLRFVGNPIGNAGLRELILWPTLKELRRLDLSYCNINSAGARLLANQDLHPELRLDLIGNPVDDSTRLLFAVRFGNRVRLAVPG